MRFFSGARTINYPDTAVELKAQIMAHSIAGPQHIPCSFFNAYFDQGGGIEHPLLGNLVDLAQEILTHWNGQAYGANLVVSMLHHRIDPLQDKPSKPLC